MALASRRTDFALSTPLSTEYTCSTWSNLHWAMLDASTPSRMDCFLDGQPAAALLPVMPPEPSAAFVLGQHFLHVFERFGRRCRNRRDRTQHLVAVDRAHVDLQLGGFLEV